MTTVAFIEVLKYILPSLIVFLTSYFLVKQMLDREKHLRKYDLHLANKKTILPIKLQAYERVILLLERITPESLIMRNQKGNISVLQLQVKILNNIRAEYEHNLSQQIYISEQAWELVKAAKENVLKLVNIASSTLEPGASGVQLARNIIDMNSQAESTPLDEAISFLKDEAAELL